MTKLEEVKKFLDEAGVFYIVSVDDKNKPKARPISFSMIEDGKLWFGVGTFKNVYKQLTSNPNIEIIAMNKGKWIRYDGVAHFVEDEKLENKCLDILGNIGKMYKENSWRMGMFYIENGHVEIKAVAKIVEEFDL
ncbi:MAG: pyridoxamine 5'-phosphate oxidase family protein [Clostridia bacterium]|nr:pyridoxamine 5'-phosphate oxidase family protein [Clostridia bacterium]